MRIFILNADRSVEVQETTSKAVESVLKCYPKGQIFTRGLFVWYPGWHCLHRDSGQWRQSTKTPEEVQLADMIVN